MDVEGFEVDALQGSMQVISALLFCIRFVDVDQLLERFRVSYVFIEIKSLDDRFGLFIFCCRFISKFEQVLQTQHHL
jgi:hypothetical protein